MPPLDDPTLVHRARRATVVLPIPRRVDSRHLAYVEHFETVSERFGVRAVQYRFAPANVDPDEDVFEGFVRFITAVYDMIHREFSPEDFVQVDLFSTDLTDQRIGTPLVRVRDASRDVLLDTVENIMQSNFALALDSGDVTIEIQHVHMPEARGYEHQRKHAILSMNDNLERVLKETKSLAEVHPDMDPFCSVVSLLMGKQWLENKQEGKRNVNFRRRFKPGLKLRRQCRQLFRKAGLPTTSGVHLSEFEKLARLPEFCDYEIMVYHCKPQLAVALHVNELGRAGKIMLFLDSAWHLYTILKPNALFGKTGALCSHCHKFFNSHVKRHTCDRFLCKQCKCKCDSYTDPNATADIKCARCCRFFFSEDCYDLHQKRGASPLYPRFTSVCSRVMACLKCGRDLKAKDGVRSNKNAYESQRKHTEHVCFKSRCRSCGQLDTMAEHTCFVKPIKQMEADYQARLQKKRGTLWFFDVECCDEERVCGDGVTRNYFVPNLVVLQREDGQEWKWEGEGCMEEFCQFVFLAQSCLASSPDKHTMFAHNASGFDSILVLKVAADTLCEDPKVIFDAGRPIKLTISNVTILDSYRYFQCALKHLPKSFDLQGVEKGHFPHLFNKLENADYEGDLPDQMFFGTEFMKEGDFEKFESWWREEDEKIRTGELPLWNLKAELLKYCRDDVRILREAWLKFEKAVHDLTGFLPGVNNVSIASLTNLVFRASITSDKQIGVVPVNHYVKRNTTSNIACEYFYWLDLFYYGGELRFSHKGTEGEACIVLKGKKHFVDAFHPASRTIFEFAGCFFHGCPLCTLPDSKCALNNKRNRDLYCEFQQRIGLLKEHDFRVEIMWECEWRRNRLEPDTQIQLKEIEDLLPDKYATPIHPRDALKGGRTCAFKLREVITAERRAEGDCIKALDFTSLYPSVMLQEEYPTGHPFVIENPTDFTPHRYFGLIKCKVIPPRALYFPVLPYRVETAHKQTKLMFPLCRTCAEALSRTPCTHSDEERALIDTWCTPELYDALERGYTLAKIYWVWDYRGRSSHIFGNFVRTFYKGKMEASGWPSGVETEEDKQRFLQDFFEHEGIRLEADKMKYDAVLRSIFKMFLNSAWGKFAQNPVKKQTKMTHEYAEFLKWISSDRIVDKNMRFLNGETVLLSGRDNEATNLPSVRGSIVHGDFVPMYGRRRSLRVLEKLGADVLYGDTDSVFFVSRKWRRDQGLEPKMGPYLGQLTTVFDSEQTTADEFVALGPKNYAYRTDDGKCVCKVRGITFNRSSSREVNMSIMCDILNESVRINVEGDEEEKRERLCPQSGLLNKTIPVNRFTIVRGDPSHVFNLAPKIVQRNYRGVFDKRVIVFDKECVTVPYGY